MSDDAPKTRAVQLVRAELERRRFAAAAAAAELAEREARERPTRPGRPTPKGKAK